MQKQANYGAVYYIVYAGNGSGLFLQTCSIHFSYRGENVCERSNTSCKSQKCKISPYCMVTADSSWDGFNAEVNFHSTTACVTNKSSILMLFVRHMVTKITALDLSSAEKWHWGQRISECVCFH